MRNSERELGVSCSSLSVELPTRCRYLPAVIIDSLFQERALPIRLEI
jgi:hypothetical protein